MNEMNDWKPANGEMGSKLEDPHADHDLDFEFGLYPEIPVKPPIDVIITSSTDIVWDESDFRPLPPLGEQLKGCIFVDIAANRYCGRELQSSHFCAEHDFFSATRPKPAKSIP